MVPGFAHDLLEPLLGVNLVKKADPFAVLLAGGSALAEEFEGSWREVQEAAGSPDEGPLSAPAAAAGVDLKNPDELPDPDGKRHEQHQLTELVEDILWVDVRRAFVHREQGDMTRMAVLNTNRFSTQWIHAWPNDQCKLDAESFHVTTSRYFGTPCPVASPYEGDTVHASQNGGVCDKYGRRLVTATLKGNPWKYKHDGWLAILLEQLRLAKADPQTNVFSLFARFFGRDVRRRHEENPKLGLGIVPDVHLPASAAGEVVEAKTLLELKFLNLGSLYDIASTDSCKPVSSRVTSARRSYGIKLHNAERRGGATPLACAHPMVGEGWNARCRRDDSVVDHSVGPAEAHLRTFQVVPIVVGHFNEASEGLLSLIDKMAEAISRCRHRELGYKSEKGGQRPAKALLMRVLGIAAARANAHHVIVARHAIGRVSAARARDSARSGVAQAAAEASDEDYHRASSRFEPDGARARQAAGENYAREGAEEAYGAGSASGFDAWSAVGDGGGEGLNGEHGVHNG
jgi:hypothetical protein